MNQLMFLILDKKHTKNGFIAWWRHDSKGYTDNLAEAGRFDEKEAADIVSDSEGRCIAVSEAEAKLFRTRVIIDQSDSGNQALIDALQRGYRKGLALGKLLEELPTLQHMLNCGKGVKVRQRASRNYYSVENTEDNPRYATLQRLLALGLVRKGGITNTSNLQFFHATRAGCVAAGLNEKEIRRALGEDQ